VLPDRVLGVPVPVRRSVAVAAVAGGALAAAGAAAAALPDTDAPVLALAAERAAVPPVPGGAVAGPGGVPLLTVPVPAAGTPRERAVLDTAGLSRAVARAQGKARELAEEARDRTAAEGRAPVPAPERADQQAEEDRRTAERARRAGRAADPEPERDRAPAATQRECGLDTGGLGAVKPHVRAAAEALGCAFDKPQVLGIAGRGGPSDHPKGLALDFMVDRATGDALAAYAVAHRAELGINYVIWRQRIDTGSGFTAMADRGGPTANHFDHVHVSFRPKAG
jgi:hypothetical protein